MNKIAPEIGFKRKSLKNVRDLWIETVNLTGRPLYEIYTGSELKTDTFDLDHFVPWSYVSNDELWNLIPASKPINIIKGNKLPNKRFLNDFVKYNYYLYKFIFDNEDIITAGILREYFEKCRNQHLNAIWATEKLYVEGNTMEQFGNILEENLGLVYESAMLQEYEMWII